MTERKLELLTMNRGSVIREKNGRKRAGLITDYERCRTSQNRWCEIMWSDGQLECFDSLIPVWDKWGAVEVISEED